MRCSTARCAPDAFLDLTLRALPRETDEQLTSRVLGYASNTWWRFLDQPQRMTRAARFESLLREGLAQAGTPSQKASWFGTLRNIALTPGTVGWLRQVWEKKETVTGLPLAEADYTSLALELAVRQVDGWKRNPDDAAGAHRESRSPRPLPVRDAGALRRSRGARAVVPDAEGRQQSPSRAVGPRRPRATCIIRCAPRRRSNTCSRASTCCGRSRRPATFSSRSGGWMSRSAGTRPGTSPIRCARS